MSSPVKAVLAGAALLGAGGTGIWLISSAGMPEWSSLSKDSSIALQESHYAKKYSRYLVGINKVEGQGVVNNDDWWEWSFKNNYRSATTSFTDGFGSGIDSWDKLKKECEKVYKGTLSGTKISVAPTQYEETNVWKLCSLLGEKPQTISDLGETNNYSNTKAAGKESDLISVKKDKNNSFWEIRNKEFYGLDEFKDEKITVAKEDKYFLDEQNKPENDRTPIREICKVAYAKPSSDNANDPTPDKIVKYCSVNLKGITSSG